MKPEYIDLDSYFSGADPDVKFERYRHLWKKAGEYKVFTSFPLHLDIELSGICNLKCKNCFQNKLLTAPLGLMDMGLFKRIITEGAQKGLCAIKLQIRGESFLHPGLFECIEFAKAMGVMDTQITTNGTLLNTGTIQKVLDSGLDGIIFSADTHHTDNFVSNDRPSRIEAAINELLARRKETSSKKPWVRIQSSIASLDKASFESAKTRIREKYPLADIHVVSRLYDFRYDHDVFDDLHTSYDMGPCSYLMHRLAVFWNGDVTVCCSDYNNRFNLGNVNDSSIEDIWKSEKLNRFRELHLSGKRTLMDVCKHCQADLSPKKDQSRRVMDKTKQHIADYTT